VFTQVVNGFDASEKPQEDSSVKPTAPESRMRAWC